MLSEIAETTELQNISISNLDSLSQVVAEGKLDLNKDQSFWFKCSVAEEGVTDEKLKEKFNSVFWEQLIPWKILDVYKTEYTFLCLAAIPDFADIFRL